MHSAPAFGATPKILFDNLHGQTFGNADWVIDGAYSDFAADIRNFLSATVDATEACFPQGEITGSGLHSCDVLVIPEPNIRLSNNEIHAIRSFVRNGGGVFLIADHGGSDRNFDGYDSSLIFNELTEPWGITFAGNTWSEAPIRGYIARDNAIVRDLTIGAWAATTIYIDPEKNCEFRPLLKPRVERGAFMVSGTVGSGRVAAMGDSSPLDDGSGAEDKNRHGIYHSWMFNNRRLAVRTIAWLLHRTAPRIPDILPPFPAISTHTRDQTPPGKNIIIVIDAAHGNTGLDDIDRFGRDLMNKLNCGMYFNMDTISAGTVGDEFILINPTIPLARKEITFLKTWVHSGGKLLIAANNARNMLSGIGNLNKLLAALTAHIRINADEVVDYRQNTGRPWSLLVTRFAPIPLFSQIDKAVFWGSASLVDPEGKPLQDSKTVQILARTSPTAKSRIYSFFKVKGGYHVHATDGLPLAAFEKLNNGKLIVLGANPLSNHQYPTAAEQLKLERPKWDHRTAQFNLSVVKTLGE